ncbi:MAG: hypothetical protein ACPLZG_11185 [Thermoproteota archaeon]
MLEEVLPYLTPLISLVIALVIFALVHDKFTSDAEKAATLICLIASSLIFYQLFLLFAMIAGLALMFTYAGVKIYGLYKFGRIARLNQRRRRNVYLHHPIRITTQNTSESNIDVSELSLKMDLTEEQ